MVSFGVMQVLSVGFNYLIESYGVWAADCRKYYAACHRFSLEADVREVVMVQSFRAIIGFAWTFFVGTWVETRGPAEPFGIFAMLMGLFSLTVVPVWLYGKRMRIATTAWVEDTRHS